LIIAPAYDVAVLAAVYEMRGPAKEVLRVEERPTPEPGPGEVRVRVGLSAVNPTDWKARSGEGAIPEPGFQIPNQDGMGTIDAVGEGVDPARVGQRCWLLFCAYQRPYGSAAQYTVVPADHAVPLPDSISDELGASMGIPALTAHRCLFADGSIDGRTVLVAGGAGAVAHYAIELARWRGARVIATVSSHEKAELARAAGAETIVNYREQDAAAEIKKAAPDGVERVVEVAFHQNSPLDAEVAAPNASVSCYANGKPTEFPARAFMTKNVTLHFVLVYTMPKEALRQAIDDVSSALDEGMLSELPAHRYPLEQIADAHDAVEGGAVGKVFVEIP
jgi:NADPH2:quinone reductase